MMVSSSGHAPVLPAGAKACRVLSAGAAIAFAIAMPGDHAARGQTTGEATPATEIARHVALVIGNGPKEGALALAQSADDATAMATRLTQRGFRIIGTSSTGAGGCSEGQPQLDLDRDRMLAAIACFMTAAKGARQAVFYFSGHSFNQDGVDVLVPAGFSISAAPSIDGAVDLKILLDGLQTANPELSMVIVEGAKRRVRTFFKDAKGHPRPPVTAAARIVAFAGPAGGWADAPANEATRSGRAARAGTGPEPDPAAPLANERPALSPFTQRVVGALDRDLDAWVATKSGSGVATLIRGAAAPAAAGSAPTAEVTVDNVVGVTSLGRMPTVGATLCERLAWGAETFGRCTEIAANYEHCGKGEPMKLRLQQHCKSDWHALVRHSMRASLVTTMKAKTCVAFKASIALFESDPSGRELPEYTEMKSLAQYTCALEASEKAKAAVAAALAARNCQQTHSVLGEHATLLDDEARGKLKAHVKDVCCAEFGLGTECLTRSAAVARVVAKLTEKTCVPAASAEVRTARALHLMERINSDGKLGLDLKANGTVIDPLWARILALTKDECSCRANETIASSGACVCQQYSAGITRRCLDKPAATTAILEGLKSLGCDIGSTDRLSDKSRTLLARLQSFDPEIDDDEITPKSFIGMERLLFGSKKPDPARLCADFGLVDGLSDTQKRVAERQLADVRDQPFAAVAVAAACPTVGKCDWAIAVGAATIEAARAGALMTCEAKAQKCVLAAAHRERTAR